MVYSLLRLVWRLRAWRKGTGGWAADCSAALGFRGLVCLGCPDAFNGISTYFVQIAAKWSWFATL